MKIRENILRGQDKSYFVKPQHCSHMCTCISVQGCDVTCVGRCAYWSKELKTLSEWKWFINDQTAKWQSA